MEVIKVERFPWIYEKWKKSYPGDKIFVIKGTSQGGRYIAGTRTISAFGRKRIHK